MQKTKKSGQNNFYNSGIEKDKNKAQDQLKTGENLGNNLQQNTAVVISKIGKSQEITMQAGNNGPENATNGLEFENNRLVIINPKRRRRDEPNNSNNRESTDIQEITDENMVEAQTLDSSSSKNDLLAGAAQQSRQAL